MLGTTQPVNAGLVKVAARISLDGCKKKGGLMTNTAVAHDIKVPQGTNFATKALASASNAEPQPKTLGYPNHLIFCVNGLFGNKNNWDVVIRHLNKYQDGRFLLRASEENQFTQTFDGIDVSGKRLADEIRATIKQYPTLRKFSIMGHSLGGLISRYAVGVLYEPETGKMAGLEPMHYVSMASPHMGTDHEGPYVVPWFDWSAEIPLVGGMVQGMWQKIAMPVAGQMLGRTGQQIFIEDNENGKPPLLARMSSDWAGEGHFISGLKSFRTHTAYANAINDHIVSWANSSIRAEHELPVLPPNTPESMGVVREDPLETAFFNVDWKEIEEKVPGLVAEWGVVGGTEWHHNRRENEEEGGEGQQKEAMEVDDTLKKIYEWHASRKQVEKGFTKKQAGSGRAGDGFKRPASPLPQSWQDLKRRLQPKDSSEFTRLAKQAIKTPKSSLPLAKSLTRLTGSKSGGIGGAGGGKPEGVHVRQSGLRRVASLPKIVGGGGGGSHRQVYADLILKRLQSMPWRRVDVVWCSAQMSIMAHNNIQVTREFINWEGDGVVEQLARELVNMDKLLCEVVDKEMIGRGEL